MQKENGKEAKTAGKKAVAKEIVKRLNCGNSAAASIYKRGFFDFARYVRAGGNMAEIKEMMDTGELPESMRAARQKPKAAAPV